MGLSAKEGTPARFVLRVMPDDDGVRVEIEDNDPGMDEETRWRAQRSMKKSAMSSPRTRGSRG
ncbi:MAG: ATP-binding protein [Proteobacteria bacterium]|nr:ATP-binding protein [Pseudomonadota bacterium]